MRIDIIMTRDDGSTITLATNHQIEVEGLRPNPRLWRLEPHFNVMRNLSSNEAWAASFMTAEMCMRFLPIEPARVALLRAAVAYNEALPMHGKGKGPQESIVHRKSVPGLPADADYRDAAEAGRDRGAMDTSYGGDVQFRDGRED